MTTRDFFYWLQGYFELSARGIFLDKAQAECVGRHLAMVTAPTERIIEIRVLCKWLTREPAPDIAGDLTEDLRALVSEEFQHVIDPQAGDADEQARLDALHKANPHLFKPGVKTPGGGVARC